MGGGIEEGIETMSSNDTADENEVTSPGRMSKPRGVAFFGCLGLGLFAAFMGVGVIIGRSFEKKANASQVSTVASQNTHVWNSGKNNYGQSGTGSNDMEEWYEPELWHGKSAKTGPSCEPDRLASNVCEGIEYYKSVGASDIGEDPAKTIAWTAFFDATLPGGPLENCVLAPVTSVADLKEIAVAAGKETYTFVGVRKSAKAVFNDNDGDGSTKNWFNLDGTPVPRGDAIWEQANNKGGLQAYAVYVSGKGLDDIENYPVRSSTDFNKAVMKCCGAIPKTFCPADDD